MQFLYVAYGQYGSRVERLCKNIAHAAEYKMELVAGGFYIRKDNLPGYTSSFQ